MIINFYFQMSEFNKWQTVIQGERNLMVMIGSSDFHNPDIMKYKCNKCNFCEIIKFTNDCVHTLPLLGAKFALHKC